VAEQIADGFEALEANKMKEELTSARIGQLRVPVCIAATQGALQHEQ
jgi:hypothetical protein